MNSGLYVRAGDCATARLAACAISLFGPTTNDSKVLRGLSPSALPGALASRRESGGGSFATAMSSASASGKLPEGEENFTLRGAPKALVIAACKAAM